LEIQQKVKGINIVLIETQFVELYATNELPLLGPDGPTARIRQNVMTTISTRTPSSNIVDLQVSVPASAMNFNPSGPKVSITNPDGCWNGSIAIAHVVRVSVSYNVGRKVEKDSLELIVFVPPATLAGCQSLMASHGDVLKTVA
ncbi:hypothetical protein HDU76_013664, partial [Blyttiomyces sp. JEL0837]